MHEWNDFYVAVASDYDMDKNGWFRFLQLESYDIAPAGDFTSETTNPPYDLRCFNRLYKLRKARSTSLS